MRMDWEIRADGVLHIDGYVNAVERDSREIFTKEGKCVERVLPGVFGKALAVADEVRMLLNHKADRQLASTKDTLTLTEDNIGLRATADITDEEVIEKARLGKLRGWSFGFRANKTEIEKRSEGVPRRILKDINLYEVSIIDDEHNPCYNSTSLNYEFRCDDMEIRTEEKVIDSYVEKWYNEYYLPRYYRYLEVRYNPYHDPSNGRFTNGTGGGKYLFMVPQGRSGQGVLVNDVGISDNKSASAYYHAIYENSTINNGKHNLVNGANANTTASASGTGTKFGVSGGIGTAYTIVSTDDGNKLIRNDYLVENADGSIFINFKSQIAERLFGKSPDYASSEHSAEPDTIAGIAKGNAMTFEEADNGKVNPNYRPFSGYSKNCQSAVVVLEERLRGYDVEVKAKSGAVMRDLSHDTTLAWIDPTTGKKPQLNALTGNKGVELDRLVKSGERYSLEYMHNSRSGHIVTVARDENNKIRVYDPQTDKKFTGHTEINNYLKGKSDIRYLRVDNLDFNETVVNAISKKPKK